MGHSKAQCCAMTLGVEGLALLPGLAVALSVVVDAGKSAVVDRPAADRLVVDQSVVEQPVVEQPVVEQPVVEQPVVEWPVVEQPVVEQPVALLLLP